MKPLNVLMIGNSFCYYYVDELYEMAKAVGVPLCIYNVYASGCDLKSHWTWWKQGAANYEQLCITDHRGRQIIKHVDLEFCLKQLDWDIISLQETSRCVQTSSGQEAFHVAEPYFTELLAYLRKRFPKARYLWHHTWAYQVGYTADGYVMADTAQQSAYAARAQAFSRAVCRAIGTERVNSGDAWQMARENPVIGDTLCARQGVKGDLGDNQHDGDIGGGSI